MMKTYLAPPSIALARNIRKYGAIAALAIGVIAVILLAQSQRPPSAQASGAASQQCVSPPGNIVRNGSFETPAGADLSVYIAPNSFEGWVVSSGSIDIVRAWQDADGEQSLDLAGYAPGVIYQDLCTVPGASYQLSFAMAGNPYNEPSQKVMEVWWDDQLVDSPTFDITGHTETSMGWQHHTYTIQAISSTTRLLFKDAYQGPSFSGPVLDAIGVLAGPPGPLPTATSTPGPINPCPAPPGNIVRNGSFETPAGADLSVYIAPNSFEGWVVSSGSIDIVRAWQDVDGEQTLDLAGYAPGVIYQDLCTVPGASYRLSFALAGNPSPGDPPTVKTMEVWWGDQLIDSPTFDITGHTGASMGWITPTYALEAISSTTRLLFKDAYPGDSLGGPALDAIVVLADPALPTPTLTPQATATVSVAQNAVAYAPLIKKSAAEFPIAINDQAIAVHAVGSLGEVYYSTILVLPGVLPSSGHYYLSASPESVAPIKVDDELVVVLDGQDAYRLFLTYPRTVEVPPAEIARWAAADSIRVEFRDRYGSVVGSSPVWLIWQP
jgi:choice-of-anchor C domain-containing protein